MVIERRAMGLVAIPTDSGPPPLSAVSAYGPPGTVSAATPDRSRAHLDRYAGLTSAADRAQAVRRRNRTVLSRTEAARMPPHQPSAAHSWPPAGWPSSRPRRVSVTGVAGWWRAKP